MKKYSLIVTGGTFDVFHKGHQAFLLAQFALSERVLIGLTSDMYIRTHKGEGRDDYETRLKNLQAFLISHAQQDNAEIAEIHDENIPSVWRSYPIEAIAATEDTKMGAIRINERRKQHGLNELPIELIPSVTAEDGKEISSSRIRHGEIDREGHVYIDPLWYKSILLLPSQLRSELARPWGDEFASIEAIVPKKDIQEKYLISVGDVVTKSLVEQGIYPHIAVVDLKVQRKEFFSSIDQHALKGYTIVSLDNPAGCLTPALFKAAKESIQQQKTVVHIHGEEDLAVLPFVLAAPLGYTVLYGQPNKGVVVMDVSEKKKNTIKNIVKKFSTQPRDRLL